jgi:glyoxylate reductase
VIPRVVCTAALPIDLPAALGEVELVAPAVGHRPLDALTRELATADALITLLRDPVDAALLDAAPRLRVVANYAVGFDNIDVAAATARGVCVTNTPDALTEATADLAFALALAAARRLGEGERLVRAGGWRGWSPDLLLGVDVWGRTLGIVGMGRIGQAMARRGRGFSMEVLYAGPRDVPAAAAIPATRVELAELWRRADVISLHCPLTPATRGLVDAAALAAMKPTAVLVNTARGACVDEQALAAALRRGQLAGAGLDVFTDEPAIAPALLACERAVLAPHLGSATTTARSRMAQMCAAAVRSVLADHPPDHLVDPGAWPRRRGPRTSV